MREEELEISLKMPLAKSWILRAITVSPMAGKEVSTSANCTSITWTIDRFQSRNEKPGEYFESPMFERDNAKWKLQMYPRGMDVKDQEHVALFLCLVDDTKKEVCAEYKFGLVDKKGRAVKKRRGTRVFVQGDWTREAWGSRHYVERKVLLNKKYGLIKADRLTVVCWVNVEFSCKPEITYERYQSVDLDENVTEEIAYEPLNEDTTQEETTETNHEQYDQLSNDLELLLQDPRFSDVTLVSSDGKQFPAHKNILAARSTVFSAMFQHDMLESRENVVRIEDIHSETLQELLRYIYTGRVRNSQVITEDLFTAADKYAIEGLTQAYERVLCENLTVDNVVDVLFLADNHAARDASLKVRVHKFIAENVKEVIDSENFKWLEANDPQFVIDTLREVAQLK